MKPPGIHLRYAFEATEQSGAGIEHPLFDTLAALQAHGSIKQAAQALGLSYRHVWGQLKAGEQGLGAPLVAWSQGRPAHLTPFAERLIDAERGARQRMAPHLAALRAELQHVLAQALDTRPLVLAICAQGPRAALALPAFAELAAARHDLHLAADPRGAAAADLPAQVLLDDIERGRIGAALLLPAPAVQAALQAQRIVALHSHRARAPGRAANEILWVGARRHANAPAWLRLQDALASPRWARVLDGLAGCSASRGGEPYRTAIDGG